MKSPIVIKLAQFNIVITIIWLFLFAWVAIFYPDSFFMRGKTTDIPIFIVMWTYVLITPVIGLVVLIIGDRKVLSVRFNYIVLFLWVLFMAWTATISF